MPIDHSDTQVLPPFGTEALERVHALWDELADYDAAQTDAGLARLQAGLCTLAGADNCDWIGVVRLAEDSRADPVTGWRPRVVRILRPNESFQASIHEQTRNLENGVVNDVIVRMVALAGRFRALRLADLEPPEWFDGPFYRQYYLDNGHDDALYVASPINRDAESYFGLFRARGRPRFSEAERDLVAYALRGLKWFHRRLLLGHGLLIADTPLTPVERQVLQGLLAGLSEKQIAARSERGFHTTHEYVRAIYRKFGVNNRAGLMALWLGRVP
jgi:DNA-binding CsgD family transcriptional regulator